jgi:hypothetical protein
MCCRQGPTGSRTQLLREGNAETLEPARAEKGLANYEESPGIGGDAPTSWWKYQDLPERYEYHLTATGKDLYGRIGRDEGPGGPL